MFSSGSKNNCIFKKSEQLVFECEFYCGFFIVKAEAGFRR